MSDVSICGLALPGQAHTHSQRQSLMDAGSRVRGGHVTFTLTLQAETLCRGCH